MASVVPAATVRRYSVTDALKEGSLKPTTTSKRICKANLEAIEAAGKVEIPKHKLYDTPSDDIPNWIIHCGVGGFHRGHMAMYMNEYNNNIWGKPDAKHWAICGMSLFDTGLESRLKPQDYMYTVVARSSKRSSAKVVSSMKEHILVPCCGEGSAEKTPAWLMWMTDPRVAVYSYTVTEAGYCRTSSGELDMDDPNLQNDLVNLYPPRTNLGMLYMGMAARKSLGIKPFTPLSCDNMPRNGELSREMLLEFAKAIVTKYEDTKVLPVGIKSDSILKDMISHITSIKFPNSMVDRITPMTKPADVELLNKSFGVEDTWPIVCEDFRSWVVEEKFVDGTKPPFAEVGCLFVPDAVPYEEMKLQLLNATHSLLCYPAQLEKFTFVDEAMVDPTLCAYINRYLFCASRGIPENPAVEPFCESVVERFGNPYIKDTLARIAQDGSSKFLSFTKELLFTLLKISGDIEPIAFGFACYLYIAMTRAELLNDPITEELIAMGKELTASPVYATTRAAVKLVYGEEVARFPRFTNEVHIALRALTLSEGSPKKILNSGGSLAFLTRNLFRVEDGLTPLLSAESK